MVPCLVSPARGLAFCGEAPSDVPQARKQGLERRNTVSRPASRLGPAGLTPHFCAPTSQTPRWRLSFTPETVRSWASEGRGDTQPTAPRDSRSGSARLYPRMCSRVLTDQNPQQMTELVPGPMQHARPACMACSPTGHPFRAWQPDQRTGASCAHWQQSIPSWGTAGHSRAADPLCALRRQAWARAQVFRV